MRPPKARDLAKLTATGVNVDRMRSLNPGLARSFELYRECRNQILVSIRAQSGRETKTKITPYTTGFASLPEPGGMLDQPYRLMTLFALFREGDHIGTLLNLQRS